MLSRPDQITQDQIQQVLDSHQDPSFTDFSFHGGVGLSASGEFTPYEANEHNMVLNKFCDNLVDAASARNIESHVTQLDRLLSKLVTVCYCRSTLREDIIPYTQKVLQRLPVYCLPLPGKFPGWLDPAYSQEESSWGGVWENLMISNTCSLNIIRVAIYISILDIHLDVIKRFLELLGELLSLASQRASSPGNQNWFIVRAALWTSWQRISMLYFFALVGAEHRLDNQAGFADEDRLALRDFQPAADLSIRYRELVYAFCDKPDYMCTWAFEFLKRQPSCIGLDLRRLLQRFDSAWGQRSGRCRVGSSSPCHGLRYKDCRRFVGLKIEDQSAHDQGCDGHCHKLVWDQGSYRRVRGIRAVCIAQTLAKGSIRYCTISTKTLAISHVWSHGQGGRPEDGINECLHERYVRIAHRYGCDSYWWDTACIPEDHVLRHEAIQGINRTFATSKVVLCCDRDIMQMDVAENTIHKQETVLATVLLSDWNIRAWTYLESMRGRNNLYLLCKDNVCIRFRDLIQNIWSEGCIDIVVLGLAVRHMLPQGSVGNHTFLKSAGHTLSYRPASRKGDDLVIWSLLIGLDKNGIATLPFGDVDQDSEEFCVRFWQTFIGEWIDTGFLMSSAPRLTSSCFTWAPRTATCLPDNDDAWLIQSNLDGASTQAARITDQGILGDWLLYRFKPKEILLLQIGPQTSGLMRRLKEICEEHLKACSGGALVHPVTEDMKAFIDPSTKDFDYSRGNAEYIGYQGRHGGTSVAVLGISEALNRQNLGWKWQSVYFWSSAVDFPPFKHVQDVLIS